MSQFMVKRYNGDDKPETDLLSCRCRRRVGRCDEGLRRCAAGQGRKAGRSARTG